jgi:hypothetical protein
MIENEKITTSSSFDPTFSEIKQRFEDLDVPSTSSKYVKTLKASLKISMIHYLV